jgi:hypothetical protein
MTLREITRSVINPVENVNGCPVVVSEDVSLKMLAASRIARVFPELFKNHRRQPRK